MIGYNRVNQLRIYNPRIRKIHVLSPVCFDKGFYYFNTSHEVADEDDNSEKLDDIQNKANDKEFSKIVTEKQVKKKATFTHSIFQSQEESIAANSDEEGDNKQFF